MTRSLYIAARLLRSVSLLTVGTLLAGCAAAAENELTVAISPDIPPYVMDKATSGLEVDLIRAALPDFKLKFVQLPYAELQTAIEMNRADVSVGVREGITPNDKQFYSDEFVDFDNYAISKDSADLSIDSVADLADHKILTWQEAYLELGEEFKQLYSPDTPERKNYEEFANQRKQVEVFWQSANAVCVIDGTIFRYFSEELGHDADDAEFHDIFPPVTEFRVGFADKALCNKFNARLKKLHDDGQYEDILERYHADLDDD